MPTTAPESPSPKGAAATPCSLSAWNACAARGLQITSSTFLVARWLWRCLWGASGPSELKLTHSQELEILRACQTLARPASGLSVLSQTFASRAWLAEWHAMLCSNYVYPGSWHA